MNRDKVMVVGPTEVEDDIRKVGSQHMTYNRTPEFSRFLSELQIKIKDVFKTSNDVFFVGCSGTGIMECAMVNFLSPGDKVLVLSGGVFGERWIEIGTSFGLQCDFIRVNPGERFEIEEIKSKLNSDVKAVFITANETSTGTKCDVEEIGKIVKTSSAILVVDAVSSMGANEFETDLWSCDVVATSTHKAFALPPGLVMISVSEKAWEKEKSATLPKYYFDLKKYKKDTPRGQTPFTPPISLLLQLSARLDKMLNEGLESVVERHGKLSKYLSSELHRMGIETFSNSASNGMVGIKFSKPHNAYEIITRLKEEFNIQITPSPEPQKDSVARVGLFGNINKEDVDALLSALKSILSL